MEKRVLKNSFSNEHKKEACPKENRSALNPPPPQTLNNGLLLPFQIFAS